jgi:hypothetical protein
MEALERLRKEWSKAPVNPAMNGARVRIPGFIVPLEGSRGKLREFLLVPYFGACIHVPPPPSNQVVLVRVPGKGFRVNEMFDMVSVTGRLRTERARNELASASYVIDATRVEAHKP